MFALFWLGSRFGAPKTFDGTATSLLNLCNKGSASMSVGLSASDLTARVRFVGNEGRSGNGVDEVGCSLVRGDVVWVF